MDKLNKTTKIDTVMQFIKNRIAQHVYLSGEKLPSVRSLAAQLSFSISTIVEAYERLVSENIIEAKTGSGYYVKGTPISYTAKVVDVQPDRHIDPLWISRQSLEANDSTLKPGCGWLPETLLPADLLRQAIRDTAKENLKLLFNYSSPLGHLPLREHIARRIDPSTQYINPDNILITDSGTQSIDLICRLFLNPQDAVLIDDPCYFNFQALLKVHHIQIISVPFTETGPDLQLFEQYIQQYRPKIYITNSGIHNPTGASLALSKAYQIMALAQQENMIIIEDDIFYDFSPESAVRYSAFAQFSQLIQIGSFSKSISASVRCGYIVAQSQWIERLINLKIATSFSHNGLNSLIIYRVLTHHKYKKYITALKAQLKSEMKRAILNLAKLDIHPWLVPDAGIFLWCRLPDTIDVELLVEQCLKDGIVLAPGKAFSLSQQFEQFLRFNVTQMNHPYVLSSLKKAIHLQTS